MDWGSDLAAGVDLLIHDAQYGDDDYLRTFLLGVHLASGEPVAGAREQLTIDLDRAAASP